MRKLLVLSDLYTQAQVLYTMSNLSNSNHSFKVVSKVKQVEIQTCLFTLHTFDCLVYKHNLDVQQTIAKKEQLELTLKTDAAKTSDQSDKMRKELQEINSYLQNANEVIN